LGSEESSITVEAIIFIRSESGGAEDIRIGFDIIAEVVLGTIEAGIFIIRILLLDLTLRVEVVEGLFGVAVDGAVIAVGAMFRSVLGSAVAVVHPLLLSLYSAFDQSSVPKYLISP
tara:strand:+ start:14502 stop:14849 length:348 start_codon:yes stop_codon:yes gene_type:complete